MIERARIGQPPRRCMLGFAATVALALGCTGADDLAGPGPSVDVPTVVPGPSPGPGTAPAPGPAPDANPAPPSDPSPHEQGPQAEGACTSDGDGTIGATISLQLDAFATSDFARAYAMTSPFFRRFLDADAFEALIRTEYPELVGNDGHRLGECLVRGRRGSLIVGVRAGTQEVILRYDLSEESDGWRIDGARRLPDGALPPQPLA